MTKTTPSGSRRMKRVKLCFSPTPRSPSASGAMAIMWRARSAKPRTSPGLWPIGRPIWRVISSAIAGPRATKWSTARLSSRARSSSGTSRQAWLALRAAASAWSISARRARPRST